MDKAFLTELGLQEKNAGTSELSFAHYTEIPVILAARFQLIGVQ